MFQNVEIVKVFPETDWRYEYVRMLDSIFKQTSRRSKGAELLLNFLVRYIVNVRPVTCRVRTYVHIPFDNVRRARVECLC